MIKKLSIDDGIDNLLEHLPLSKEHIFSIWERGMSNPLATRLGCKSHIF